jgi:hypothetical protein
MACARGSRGREPPSCCVHDYDARSQSWFLPLGLVSVFFLSFLSCSPFHTRSNANQRVERMWLDLGKNFGRTWKAFFMRLGHLHGLDRRDPHHLWLLHQLFLADIGADCQKFRDMWNHHPITGKKHNMSPVVCWSDSFFYASQLFQEHTSTIRRSAWCLR